MITGDNLAGFRTRIRRWIHEPNSQTSWWTDDFLDQLFNNAYRKRNTQLVSAHEGYYTLTASTPVIKNEPFYAWPDGFERLTKLEIEVVNDGTRVPLERWERRSAGISTTVPVIYNYLPTYRPVGGGFVLEPAFGDGLASSSTLFESFDGPASEWTATTDSVASLFTGTGVLEGSGAIQIDKTGTTDATPTVLIQKSVALDLSDYETVEYSVYVPTLSVLDETARAVYFVIATGVGAYEYRVDAADLSVGWNTITVDLSSPDVTFGAGATLSNIDTINFGLGISVQATIVYGFLFDAFQSYSQEDPEFNLILEYVGIPQDLVDDAETLHPEFPASFEELLVLDAACSAMASESALESGAIRAIARERAEWDVTFQRYVDSRMESKEVVDPFVGHYVDA